MGLRRQGHLGILSALTSAALFGAATPLAKHLLGEIQPLMLAGLLYTGSGLGLIGWQVLRHALFGRRFTLGGLPAGADLLWLAGAIAAGGIAGPALLMVGLAVIPASTASLLLNLEGVLTVLLAWLVFRESFDARILLGVVLIVAACILLSIADGPAPGISWGALAIAGACLCWAIDNNLTRKVSVYDPVTVAAAKGLAAGLVNVTLASLTGSGPPGWIPTLTAASVGFLGYGISLALFVLALRYLGAARTSAYFSLAPFVGAALAIVFLQEMPTASFWLAAGLMGAGIGLHLSERHEHVHHHEAMYHAHWHRHDEHHEHDHELEWDPRDPRAHGHSHSVLTHAHAHFPDIHHRHDHDKDGSG